MKRTLGSRRRSIIAVLSILSSGVVFIGCGSSGPPPDTTPPSTPANLVATAVSSTQINLTWTASTDNVGVTGYKVERCQGGGCSSFSQIATTTNTSFNDTGLTPSTSYSYRVRATDAAGNLSGYSNAPSGVTAAAAISVSLTPRRGGLTFSQAFPFSATVQNDVGAAGVTWSATGAGCPGTCGAFGQVTSTSATYIAPNFAGLVAVTATSKADGTKSASATIGVTDLTGVTTYHNDLSRDGANIHEFALTPANLNTTTFGKLFSCAVDGAIYAQPLWVAAVSINTAKHNVVIVATMHDSVYAFDADTNANPCVPLWHASLTDPAHGGTAGESSVAGALVGQGFGDIRPEIGVTGTPVIDLATNTVYLVSKSVNNTATQFFQRLHALDLTSGIEKLGGPASITSAITFPGTADGGTAVAFNPQNQGQRPGLVLLPNGIVYVAWASHEDAGSYHGWVMGFDKTSLGNVSVYNSSPNGRQGGIWMSGGAPAADTSNNLYVITGNGDYDGVNDFGDSILKLSSSLLLLDSFTPSVQQTLDQNDFDLGSGGATTLVDSPSAPAGSQHLLIGGGKGPTLNGVLYVANRDNLGQFSSTDAGIKQEFPLGGMDYATPAFWQNNLYIAAVGQPLMAFSFNPLQGQFNSSPTSQSTANFAFPGGTASISSNGTNNGIVWVIDSSQYCTQQSPGCGPALLRAYDATNLATELWNSSMAGTDKTGLAVKFTVPTIANGKVYVGTRGNDTGSGTPTIPGELDVYGLKPD